MTTTHEDIDSESLEVGDLWDLVYDLDHTIKALRRDVYELEQQIAESLGERRALLDTIEENVGDIDWGY